MELVSHLVSYLVSTLLRLSDPSGRPEPRGLRWPYLRLRIWYWRCQEVRLYSPGEIE
jgi:hypothetical protein